MNIFYVIAIIIYLGSFLGLWYLFKKSWKISEELNSIELEAKNSYTIVKLNEVLGKLEKINKKCFHKTQINRVNIIFIIIKTKIGMLNKNKTY